MPNLRSVRVALSGLALVAAASCRHSEPESLASAQPAEVKPPGRAPASPAARRWWRDAVFYEVFVRSFADSDGDGVGDLNGLTARLDALNDGEPATTDDLGVDALWLMPIHPSPSYHGYDVTDYDEVNPDYGSIEDLDRLLEAAHARGVRVIVDFVLNHSSSEHPWFIESAADPGSDKRAWYTWREEPDPRFRRPWDGSPDIWHRAPTGWYYGLFWSGMPDLNLDHPPVEAAMLASMQGWLDRGLDGFRVDAVRYLIETADGGNADTPPTHAVSRRLRAAIEARHPEALLVAEAWTSPEKVAPYRGDGDEYHLAFAFSIASAIMTSAKDGLRASLDQGLRTALDTYPDLTFLAPFLTNHDMRRAQRQLDEAGAQGAERPAAATLFALPGTPFVYYGEEIGMRGGASGADEDKRTPMRWRPVPSYGFTSAESPWREAAEPRGVDVKTQRADSASLWSLYRDLIALRHRTPALTSTALVLPRKRGGGRGTTGFIRGDGAERVLFVVNFHDQPGKPLRIEVGAARPELLFGEGIDPRGFEVREGWLEIAPLEGRGFGYLKL